MKHPVPGYCYHIDCDDDHCRCWDDPKALRLAIQKNMEMFPGWQAMADNWIKDHPPKFDNEKNLNYRTNSGDSHTDRDADSKADR